MTKLLIVDDDLTLSFLVSEALEGAGFKVVDVNNGEDCLDNINSINPDIILLDVLMPGIDGYEVCKKIRQKEKFKHTPILMMTGMDDDASVQSAFHAGATDFVAKPFNMDLLLQRVLYIARNGNVTKALVNSERRLEQAQQLAKLAYWEWNARTGAVYWSNSINNILEINPKDMSQNFQMLLNRVGDSDKELVQNWIQDAIGGNIRSSITHAATTTMGEVIHLHQQLKPDYDADGKLQHLYGSLLDVTEMHQAQNEIRKLAYYDVLTGLPNRVYFKDLLKRAVDNIRRYDRLGALLFIDLDNFKRINDTMGHHIGDLLLNNVAEAIQSVLRSTDVFACDANSSQKSIARLAGDEFTLILSEINQPEDAGIVAERLLARLKQPFEIEGNEVSVSASIGIAIIPQDGQSSEEYLRNSDIAMYTAKSEGKNTFKFFDQAMNLKAKHRMKMENALRNALDNNEFTLLYQPQIEIETGEMHGVEALIRWHSKELGFVPPLDFIPLAEETGMIIPIGNWVLKEACHQAKAWLDIGVQLKRVAVNVSTRQFSQMGFDQVVQRTLNEADLPAHFLELEMTESLLMKQSDKAITMLNKLKQVGVGLSIDDFGTGYSSLAYLKQFPIDHIKIDKAFIDNVNADQSNAAIVKAVIAMASSMSLRVTAEGVENFEQLDFLRARLCTEAQGYYFSRPVDPAGVEDFAKKISNQKVA